MASRIGIDEYLVLLAVVAIAFFALVKMIHSVRQNRASTYYECPECGYDIRATPDRCPECGRRASARASSSRVDVTRLLETAPADEIRPRTPEPTEETVVVYETDSPEDAATLCEHIIARGMACSVRQAQSALRLDGRGAAYYELLVWSGDADPAKALVARATEVRAEVEHC